MDGTPKITRQRELEAEINFLTPRLVMLGARQIIAHGAVARGTARKGSKINLIVVAESELPFRERQQEFRERLKSRERVDIIVYTPAEFSRAREESALVKAALCEGRIVYSPERG
ncbi:MAG: nucleotidyltransferase domain-containing protein [Candidatus Zixiibacteriota bacterium]|jgi:predicted nucleotidyltransferase